MLPNIFYYLSISFAHTLFYFWCQKAAEEDREIREGNKATKKQFRYCWKSCTLISCYQVSIILGSAIFFMIRLRRAGIKNWVKYAILRVQMSTPYTSASVKTRLNILVLLLKGAVSRNSVKLGNYKMPVKLRET